MYMMTLFDTLVAIQDEDEEEYEDRYCLRLSDETRTRDMLPQPREYSKSNITDWKDTTPLGKY